MNGIQMLSGMVGVVSGEVGVLSQRSRAGKRFWQSLQRAPVSEMDLTSVLGMAQPHLHDLPTPGLQLRIPPHNIIPLVEEVDHPLHTLAQRRELISVIPEGFSL